MPYESIDEAVEIANATRHALGASVFGPDKYECLDVAKRLECGMVAINDFGVFYVSIAYSAEFLKALIQFCTAEVCALYIHCTSYTHNLFHPVKIYRSEEQNSVAMGDLVCSVPPETNFSG